MGFGIIAAGMAQGAGEAGVKAGQIAQKQLGDEDLLKMKVEADRELAISMESLRNTNARAMQTEVVQPFQSSERVATQTFQGEQQQRGFTHAENLQQGGFKHSEALQAAKMEFDKEQNSLNRDLTREQIAASKAIAAGNNAISLQIAKIGGSVQTDKDGNVFFVDKEGGTKPVMDPNKPGQPLKSLKDLTPAAKAYADVIKAQMVGLDKEEVAALDDSQRAKIVDRRAALNRELLNVLTGGISEAGKPPPVPAAPPAAGAVIDGFKFKGGDPKDKKNWSPVESNPAAPAPKADARAGSAGGGLIGKSMPTPSPESPASPEDNRMAALRAERDSLPNTRQGLARRRAIDAELNGQ